MKSEMLTKLIWSWDNPANTMQETVTRLAVRSAKDWFSRSFNQVDLDVVPAVAAAVVAVPLRL